MTEKMINSDEELEMDNSAYEMYHQAQTTAPCLSFDLINDDLGNNRTEYPHTCFLVAGTQAETMTQNHVIVLKLSNMKKTYKANDASKSDDSDSEEDGEDEEDEDDKPELEAAFINHNGCVNRIRNTQIDGKNFTATWSEVGRVFIWNLTEQLAAVSDPKLMTNYVKKTSPSPVFQFNGHQTEGFAIDWSPLVSGQLASGDCQNNIHIWKITDDKTSWNVDQRPYLAHKASVEDIQWSPNEPTVFASCSVDKSIRVWDIRASPLKANMLSCENAHDGDINVISWNRKEPFIASGGDDSILKIWDLRLFDQKKPVALFKFHTKPITSIEWNQNESTIFAASSEDNKLTIWDLAIEKDDAININNNNDENNNQDELVVDEKLKNIPEQLLFIHEGQKEMKELHWHKQIPGVIVSTAHSGFNIFKTISV